MKTKQFEEKEIDDAPLGLNNSESAFWAQGYNTALEKTNAKELLEALIEIKRLYGDRTDYIGEYKTAWNNVNNAINKATK